MKVKIILPENSYAGPFLLLIFFLFLILILDPLKGYCIGFQRVWHTLSPTVHDRHLPSQRLYGTRFQLGGIFFAVGRYQN